MTTKTDAAEVADAADRARTARRAAELDAEIEQLTADVEAHRKAEEESRKIRRMLAPAGPKASTSTRTGSSTATSPTYARDVILTGTGRTSGRRSPRRLGDNIGAAARRSGST